MIRILAPAPLLALALGSIVLTSSEAARAQPAPSASASTSPPPSAAPAAAPVAPPPSVAAERFTFRSYLQLVGAGNLELAAQRFFHVPLQPPRSYGGAGLFDQRLIERQ